MMVSEPQRLTMSENFVRGLAHWVANKGVDPHEFAKSYVDRTVQLGYAPDLKVAAQEFVSERIGG
jgi:hypothetical protein